MITELQTTIGVLKLVPEAIQVGKDIWNKLKPPREIEAADAREGIAGDTFYSASKRFAISIPNDDWEFWKPSPQFLASMGPMFNLPNRSMPIMVMSKSLIKLFRPNVNVMVEEVGNYTNIEEMMIVTRLFLQSQGHAVQDDDIVIDSSKQCGQIVSMQDYLSSKLIGVQNCYLNNGMYYTITASYVPMSDYSNTLFGGLQEIMNSFKVVA